MEPLSIQQKKDVRAVIAAVAQLYSLGPYDRAYALLRGKVERQHAITRPRHLAMYALRRWYGFKWWEVGYAFNRQHSTAADGVGQLEAELRWGTNGAKAELDALARALGVVSEDAALRLAKGVGT